MKKYLSILARDCIDDNNEKKLELINGYYVSGVFKLNDPNIEHDPDCKYGGNTNYNNLLKIIMYDKP